MKLFIGIHFVFFWKQFSGDVQCVDVDPLKIEEPQKF